MMLYLPTRFLTNTKMNIVTTKFSNQPREVIANCPEDLSSETIRFLEDYGYTEAQIKAAFESKKL